jgi:zinc transporter 5/7
LKYVVVEQLKFSIVAVNVAASLVFFVSATESDLKTSRLIPVVLAAISLTLEYVILSKPFSPVSLLNIALPLLITVNDSDDSDEQGDGKHKIEEVIPTSRSIIKELLSHSDTRAIFNFLLLNATFMFIQLLYSFRSKSLGLLSDSLHMALDCTSLALGLLAGVLSKQPADGNGRFPFGLKNFETLAGFTNGTLLIGISGSIVFEAIGRLFNPVKLQKTNELIIVSLLGLFVNLVGIFAFNHGHGHSHSPSHGHSHTHEADSHHSNDLQHSHDHGHAHSHQINHSHDDEKASHGMNENMKGIFLHILADTLGSVGVVVSTVLTKVFGWEGFDPIASIIIAGLIFFSSLPLIKTTASSLLLQVSPKKEIIVREVLNEILAIKGVKSITTPRFWPINNELQGYIHIQIFRGENGGYIKKQCEKSFESRAIDVRIQMEYDYDDCWCRKKKQ